MSANNAPDGMSQNRAVDVFSNKHLTNKILHKMILPKDKAAALGSLRASSSKIRNQYPVPKYYTAITTLAKHIDEFEKDVSKSIGKMPYKKHSHIIVPMNDVLQETVKNLKNEVKTFMHECMLNEEPLEEVTTAFIQLTKMLDFQLKLANREVREKIMSNTSAAMLQLYNECKRDATFIVEGQTYQINYTMVMLDYKHIFAESKWNDADFAQLEKAWHVLKEKYHGMSLKKVEVDTIIEKIKLLAIGFKVNPTINNTDLQNISTFKEKVRIETLTAENEDKIRNLLKTPITAGAARGARGKRPGAAKPKAKAKRIDHYK